MRGIFKKLSGKGKLTEKDINEAAREIKLALLEADVSLAVVKKIVERVRMRALEAEVLDSLSPAQNVTRVVREELTEILGGENAKLNLGGEPPAIIMMVGLQGAGKTTTAGKLALMLKNQGKRPLLASCDIYRPAAAAQLEILCKQSGAAFFQAEANADAVKIATSAKEHAKRFGNDVLIIDTAGRLQIDEDLMNELRRIKEATNPAEILLVIDAMTGQEGANVAAKFDEELGITGIILSKFDGDARGGVALSVKETTQKPIKFFGSGEKLPDLEVFHPGRIVSRILGMGDVLTLIERAENAIDEKRSKELEEKLREGEFTFDDLADNMERFKKMGSIADICAMMPGFKPEMAQEIDLDEKKMRRSEAIIKSMTPSERACKVKLDVSRRNRIARGSGNTLTDVNKLVKQHEEMQKITKLMSGKLKSLGGRGMNFLKKMKRKKKQ